MTRVDSWEERALQVSRKVSHERQAQNWSSVPHVFSQGPKTREGVESFRWSRHRFGIMISVVPK